MRIQTGMLVPLGYGKYVRSERVAAIMPIEEERGRAAALSYSWMPRTSPWWHHEPKIPLCVV